MLIKFIFFFIYDILINISCMNDFENINTFKNNGIFINNNFTILEVEKIKYENINFFP